MPVGACFSLSVFLLLGIHRASWLGAFAAVNTLGEQFSPYVFKPHTAPAPAPGSSADSQTLWCSFLLQFGSYTQRHTISHRFCPVLSCPSSRESPLSPRLPSGGTVRAAGLWVSAVRSVAIGGLPLARVPPLLCPPTCISRGVTGSWCRRVTCSCAVPQVGVQGRGRGGTSAPSPEEPGFTHSLSVRPSSKRPGGLLCRSGRVLLRSDRIPAFRPDWEGSPGSPVAAAPSLLVDHCQQDRLLH